MGTDSRKTAIAVEAELARREAGRTGFVIAAFPHSRSSLPRRHRGFGRQCSGDVLLDDAQEA